MESSSKKVRPQRTPTTKISQRKRTLFEQDNDIESMSHQEQQQQQKHIQKENANILDGIALLSPKTRNKASKTREKLKFTSLRKNISNNNLYESSSDDDDDDDNDECIVLPETPSFNTPKKFTPSEDELRVLFNDTLKFQNKNKCNIFDENSSFSSDIEEDDDIIAIPKRTNQLNTINRLKRTNKNKTIEEPKDKIAKTKHNNSTLSQLSPESIEPTCIPPEKFYSKTPPNLHTKERNTFKPLFYSNQRKPKISRIKKELGSINKGVYHNIRRASKKFKTSTVEEILKSFPADKFKKLRENRKFNQNIEEISNIFKNSTNSNEWVRPLSITGCREGGAGGGGGEGSTCNETTTIVDFSDSEYESGDDIEEIEEKNLSLRNDKNLPKKFFTSGSDTIKNVYKINKHMRATVRHGKLIVQCKKRKRKTKELLKMNIFDNEQKTVNDIISMLDTTGEISPPSGIRSLNTETITANNTNENNYENSIEIAIDDEKYKHFRQRIPYRTDDPELIEQQNLLLDFLIVNNICTEDNFKIFISDPDNHKEEAARIVDSLVVVIPPQQNESNMDEQQQQETDPKMKDFDYEKFRKQLPYNTIDSAVIQQQETLLEFLITNQICNEENFKIFITDPENHKEEGLAIINSIVADKSAATQSKENNNNNNETEDDIDDISDQPIPYVNINTMDLNQNSSTILIEQHPDSVRSPSKSLKQIENIQSSSNLSPSKVRSSNTFFPIFYPGKCQPLKLKSTRKHHHHTQQWNHGIGKNQYQIDAGQKQFGAKQCPKCGLLYTVHEPEEEKLHENYHNSMEVLRFKGWTDEDVVIVVPEWSTDGRIIKITNSAVHFKRQEKLKEILNFIDQELGFSSYIIPTNFVAYLAVKKQQIIGFCLVQPLEVANKYICINGVDCCTEDTFPVRCGISRIWVSSFHRRMGIASKLIQAVQLFTIIGEEIDISKIAFSSPTIDGKAFVKAITNQENFLVYQ